MAVDCMANADTHVAVAVAAAPTALIVGYGVAKTVSVLFSEARSAIFTKVSQTAVRVMSRDIFLHVLHLDSKFHANRETGALLRSIDRGTKGISTIMSSLLFHFIPTALEIGLVGIVLTVSFGPQFALGMGATVAAYTVFTFVVTQWRTEFRKKVNFLENRSASRATDSLLNLETVKCFTNELHEAARFDETLEKVAESNLKVGWSLAFLNFGQHAIFSAGLVGLLLMASKGVAEGTMSLGDVVLVNGLMIQLSFPLNFLGMQYREMRQALVDMEGCFSLADQKPDISHGEGEPSWPIITKTTPNSPREHRLSIEFQNVSFGYDEARGKKIFDKLSFYVPGGHQVAFVGASGSGKSTVGRLLFRLYEPDSGTIRVNGTDISKVSVESLRKSVAVIPQEVVLFNESIAYNIGYGKVGAPFEKIVEAAKRADIHDTIMSWPHGYNTQVGERGLKISGGEKQRVSIARAVLKDAPIILMDESTSALDSETEARVLSRLEDIFVDRTIITIAHRLSSIVKANNVFVLDRGRIIESGTHTDLLNHGENGVYHKLWMQQQHTMTGKT